MKSFVNKFILKFKYAFTGLFHGIAHDSSIKTQVLLGLLMVIAGCLLHFTKGEWLIVILAIALVIGLEFVNSALEKLCDLVTTEYHETIKQIKDYAAAAVLTVSIGALIIGLLLIGGKLC